MDDSQIAPAMASELESQPATEAQVEGALANTLEADAEPKNTEELLDSVFSDKPKQGAKKTKGPAAGDAAATPQPGAIPPTGEAAAAGIKYPQHWSAERKAFFDTLPDELKKGAIDWGSQIESGLKSSADKSRQEFLEEKRAFENDLNFGRSIRELFPQDLKNFLNQKGLDESSVLRQSIANFIVESQNPIQYVADVLSRNGYSLGDFVQAVQAQQEENPVATQLQAFTQPLMQELQSLKQAIAAKEAMGAQQKANTLLAYLGNKEKFPFYEQVKESMAQLAPAIIGSKPESEVSEADIDKVYDTAVWQNPELRAQMIALQTAQKAEEDRKAADLAQATTQKPEIIGEGVGVGHGANPRNVEEMLNSTIT